jgi:hypothetical protein
MYFWFPKLLVTIFFLGYWQGERLNKDEKQKKPTPPSPPERKNQGPSSGVHGEPSHWLPEISISKTVHCHFWPGLMAGSVIWGHSLG